MLRESNEKESQLKDEVERIAQQMGVPKEDFSRVKAEVVEKEREIHRLLKEKEEANVKSESSFKE